MKAQRIKDIEGHKEALDHHEQLLQAHAAHVEEVESSNEMTKQVHAQTVQIYADAKAHFERERASVKGKVRDALLGKPEPPPDPPPMPSLLPEPPEPPFQKPAPPTYSVEEVSPPKATTAKAEPVHALDADGHATGKGYVEESFDGPPPEPWTLIETPDGEARAMPGNLILTDDDTGEKHIVHPDDFERQYTVVAR